MSSGFVYILKSEKNGSYYLGSTKDPKRRIIDHNNGKSGYTRNNRPFKLMLLQEYTDLKAARQIEYKLKKFANRNIIDKIVSEGKITLGS